MDEIKKKISKTFKLDLNSHDISQVGEFKHLIKDHIFYLPKKNKDIKELSDRAKMLKTISPKLRATIPLFVFNKNNIYGYQTIKGKPYKLWRYYEENKRHRRLSLELVADFLTNLHSIDRRKYRLFNLDHYSTHQAYYKILKSNYQKSLQKKLTISENKIIEDILLNLKSQNINQKPKFIHGHLDSSSLLWDKNSKRLSVINWQHRNLGDPAYDFAWLYREFGPQKTKYIYNLYDGAKDKTFINRVVTYSRSVIIEKLIQAEHKKDKSFNSWRRKLI